MAENSDVSTRGIGAIVASSAPLDRAGDTVEATGTTTVGRKAAAAPLSGEFRGDSPLRDSRDTSQAESVTAAGDGSGACSIELGTVARAVTSRAAAPLDFPTRGITCAGGAGGASAGGSNDGGSNDGAAAAAVAVDCIPTGDGSPTTCASNKL